MRSFNPFRPLRLLSRLVLAALFVQGCQTGRQNPTLLSPERSEALQQTAAGPRVHFKKPGILKTYEAYYVEPVLLYANDSGRLTPATSEELNRLAVEFRSKIVRALGDRVTHFNQPARNVAILRVAITDVWSDRTLLNLRPGLIIPNTASGGASMEAQVFDSVSKGIVAEVADSRRGARRGFMSGLGKWSGADAAIDEWALLLQRSIAQGSR